MRPLSAAPVGRDFEALRERLVGPRSKEERDPELFSGPTERRWHASPEVRRRADGGAELSFAVDGTRELRRFILQLGADVDVLEPGSLREEIAGEHELAARLAREHGAETLTPDDTGVRQKSRAMSGGAGRASPRREAQAR